MDTDLPEELPHKAKARSGCKKAKRAGGKHEPADDYKYTRGNMLAIVYCKHCGKHLDMYFTRKLWSGWKDPIAPPPGVEGHRPGLDK